MTLEQKFSSHLVSKRHRVRQATSEFENFAIIWWNELLIHVLPTNMECIEREEASSFCSPSYRCDFLKKLQHLDQGDMSVQEYYCWSPALVPNGDQNKATQLEIRDLHSK
jgi:hypothetical protein